jgi:hypothetical protein
LETKIKNIKNFTLTTNQSELVSINFDGEFADGIIKNISIEIPVAKFDEIILNTNDDSNVRKVDCNIKLHALVDDGKNYFVSFTERYEKIIKTV